MTRKIVFIGQRNCLKAINKTIFKQVLDQLCKDHSFKIKNISYVMVSDEQLKEINVQHLNHDYYTDIITFDLSENPTLIDGELYISIDRVKDNTKTSFEEELLRVMFHGVLHLCGHRDKTREQKLNMRKKEDQYITLYLNSIAKL